jgi:hypothetical protein
MVLMALELLPVCVTALPIDEAPTGVVNLPSSVIRRVDNGDNELVNVMAPLLHC